MGLMVVLVDIVHITGLAIHKLHADLLAQLKHIAAVE